MELLTFFRTVTAAMNVTVISTVNPIKTTNPAMSQSTPLILCSSYSFFLFHGPFLQPSTSFVFVLVPSKAKSFHYHRHPRTRKEKQKQVSSENFSSFESIEKSWVSERKGKAKRISMLLFSMAIFAMILVWFIVLHYYDYFCVCFFCFHFSSNDFMGNWTLMKPQKNFYWIQTLICYE